MLNHIPKPRQNLYGFRSTNEIPPLTCRTERFKKSFYPDSIRCWNNIGPEFRDTPSLSLFKSKLLELIRPAKKSIFDYNNPLGLKYLYQLRVGLSSLKAHKKAHNFADTSNNNCACAVGTEDTVHFLLKCVQFNAHRQKLLDTVYPIISKIYDLQVLEDSFLTNILLYGDKKLTLKENRELVKATVNFIQNSKRFTELQE